MIAHIRIAQCIYLIIVPNELLAVSFKADGHADRQYRSCPLRAVDVTVSEEIANMCLKRVFFEGKREKMEHRVRV